MRVCPWICVHLFFSSVLSHKILNLKKKSLNYMPASHSTWKRITLFLLQYKVTTTCFKASSAFLSPGTWARACCRGPSPGSLPRSLALSSVTLVLALCVPPKVFLAAKIDCFLSAHLSHAASLQRAPSLDTGYSLPFINSYFLTSFRRNFSSTCLGSLEIMLGTLLGTVYMHLFFCAKLI